MRNISLTRWAEDIDQLVVELPQRHKNLFFQIKEKTFLKQIERLKANLDGLDEYSIAIKIAEIVAMVGDAHTTVTLPVTRYIPFEFYWFSEGMYIVAASNEYSELIHCKITHIAGTPIKEVIQRVTRIVSHENESFLKAQLPKYIMAVEVLYGLEVLDEFSQIPLTIERANGEITEVMVSSYESHALNTKAVKKPDVPQEKLPLYRRNKDKSFWRFYIQQTKTLYFNYNSCRDMQDISVEKYCIDMMHTINTEDVSKLVIDLRNNLGGNSTLLDPFIMGLKKCKKLNREGGIFIILGRETFSSGLLNAYSLKNKTKAIFVGEATGGKPNCYGEVKYFELINSKLKIKYSTEYYQLIKDDKQPSFFPDIKIEVTFDDYINNKDPIMEYIVCLGY